MGDRECLVHSFSLVGALAACRVDVEAARADGTDGTDSLADSVACFFQGPAGFLYEPANGFDVEDVDANGLVDVDAVGLVAVDADGLVGGRAFAADGPLRRPAAVLRNVLWSGSECFSGTSCEKMAKC